MDRSENIFLRRLDLPEFRVLSEHLHPVKLDQGQSVGHAGARIEWVHFPSTAVISLIALGGDGSAVEASMVGNEGANALAEVLGSGEAAVEMTVQIGGDALRCSAGAIRSVFLSSSKLQSCVWPLMEFQLAEARRSALCIASHPANQRLARWLLESSDRTGGLERLPLTQTFLAAMLCVQRTTVSRVAGELQAAGLITYRRGVVDLLDRPGLEFAACECRTFTREQRDRLGL